MISSVQDLYFEQYIKDVIAKETKLDINTNDVIKKSNVTNRQQKKKFLKFAYKSSDEYKQPLMTLAHMSKSLQISAEDMEIPYTYLGVDLDEDFEKNIEKVKHDIIYISRGTINDSYNEKIIKDIIGIFEDEKNKYIIFNSRTTAMVVIYKKEIDLYKCLKNNQLNSNFYNIADCEIIMRKSK